MWCVIGLCGDDRRYSPRVPNDSGRSKICCVIRHASGGFVQLYPDPDGRNKQECNVKSRVERMSILEFTDETL